MLLFFSNEFSVIYMYLLKNLNNFELMDKQEAIILLLTVYLTLSLSRELEHLETKIIPFCYIPKTDSTMRKRSQEGLPRVVTSTIGFHPQTEKLYKSPLYTTL